MAFSQILSDLLVRAQTVEHYAQACVAPFPETQVSVDTSSNSLCDSP